MEDRGLNEYVHKSLLDLETQNQRNLYKLKLDNEISFDNSTYDLYATSGDAGGKLTFIFNFIG